MRELAIILLLAGCASSTIGKAPELTPIEATNERAAMATYGLLNQHSGLRQREADHASLWARDRASLLGDRRAMQRGDILTVVIEIDERAEISNSSARGRSASQQMTVPQLLGFPQRVNPRLPEGASMSDAVQLNSQSSASGDGSVRRNEKLTLRVAATIVNVLPNGVLAVSGQQEVRVNFELRELSVSGYVRPEDVSRQNEITYDKIAAARVSYGGRGQITDMQQPRYGQQALESVLPF